MRLDVNFDSMRTSDSFLIDILCRLGHGCARAISSASLAGVGSSNETMTELGELIAALSSQAEMFRLLRPPISGCLVDFTQAIASLCRAIATSSEIEDRGITLLLIFDEPILLDTEKSWRASLIVFELVCDACSHEFSRFGSVRVHLATMGDKITCRVDNDGKSASADKYRLGVVLPEALADEIGGAIKRSVDRSGSSAVLSFPRGLHVVRSERESVDALS